MERTPGEGTVPRGGCVAVDGSEGSREPLLSPTLVLVVPGPRHETGRHALGDGQHRPTERARYAASASAFVRWIVPGGCSGGE
jgi:hypothetical protein